MCCAIPNPVYAPDAQIISSITNASPASVTTTTNHNYLSGTIVRLLIPPGFGMTQANQLFGEIFVTSPTTFNIDIDTLSFDAFVIPVVGFDSRQQAQTIPIGEINEILSAAVHNIL